MAEALGVLEHITKGLRGLINRGIELDKEAISTVTKALNETQIYIGMLEKGQPRNEAIEHKLSRLWQSAAVNLRGYDTDLAERSLLKSNYWANPDRWDENRLHMVRINIEQVHHDISELL